MRVPTFLLERNQTLYENHVEINLTESGVHPCTVEEIVGREGLADLAAVALGYGWTDGRPGLRQAIADWYPGAEPRNVLVANGSSEANLLALAALTEPGDEIVVIVPNFMQLDGLAQGLGLDVRRVALVPDRGWQPDVDAVRAAVGPRTKLITLCDPNNPTGIALAPAARRGLAEVAEETGAWLLVDEIYRGGEIDGGPSPTAWGLGSRVIVSGGLSKSFACPGLRLGWLVAPEDLVNEGHRRQDYTTIGTGALSQHLAERVLEPGTRERILARGRAILARGRAQVRDWAARRNDWSLVEPQAGGMAFLGYGFGMPSEELVARLREEEGVFVCAGTWFGLEGHVRLGIGVEDEHLAEGLRRLDRFLDRHGLGARTEAA